MDKPIERIVMSETTIYCPLCKSKSHVGFVWQETHEIYGHKGQIESFGVNCSVCSCAVSGFKAKDEAIKSWNTRADQAVIDTLVEALQFADDNLQEINPSNYSHEDVCFMNAKNVEVILFLRDALEKARAGK